MNVIKKNGQTEPFNYEKITRMIDGAVEGLDRATILKNKIESNFSLLLKDGITTTEIQEQIISVTRNLIDIDNTEMSLVAGKLLMSKIIGEAEKSRGFKFGRLVDLYEYHLSDGLYEDDIDLNTYYIILRHLETVISKSYNYTYNYSSVASWQLRYLHKDETPVEVFALIAARITLHGTTDIDSKLKEAEAYLDVLCKQQISLATPFLLNLRIKNGNLSSCFVMDIPDDLEEQYDSLKAMATISKNGGGIGAFIGGVRAKGSRIKHTKGIADSVIPFIKTINDTALYVNQGGKRVGAVTVALPLWHADILDYLNLQTETGDVRRKAHDIFLQVTAERGYMEALRLDHEVPIVCPLEVKEVFGLDLVNDVTAYSDNIKVLTDALGNGELTVGTVIRARALFKLIMAAQLVKGTPYFFFSDTVNKVNPLKDVASIKSTNLCVVGDTKILTDSGYQEIQTLENQTVNCWNGEKFTPTPIFRTDDGEGSKVLRVLLSNGQEVEATEYHRWALANTSIKETKDLTIGDNLIKHGLPTIPEANRKNTSVANGNLRLPRVLELQEQGIQLSTDYVTVVGIIDEGKVAPVFCGTEPERNMLMFNGVLTMNCVESTSAFNKDMTHTCNLVSLVLPNINMDTELQYVATMATNMLDAIVDISTSPTGKAQVHNDALRVLGIGAMGLHDLLASNDKTYKDTGYIERIFERISLYTLEASIKLAMDKGSFPMYEESEWAKGLLYSRPLEWYRLHSTGLYEEWERLYLLQKKYGIRNLQLQAIAPNTSSSVLQGVTSSILPTFSKFHSDSSSLGALPIFPKYIKEKFWYYKEYQHHDVKEMNTVIGKIQKWVDSGISYEWAIKLDEVSISDIADYYINAYAKGVKTVYYVRYIRTDGSSEDKEECVSCAG